jgi:hypothetical protein
VRDGDWERVLEMVGECERVRDGVGRKVSLGDWDSVAVVATVCVFWGVGVAAKQSAQFPLASSTLRVTSGETPSALEKQRRPRTEMEIAHAAEMWVPFPIKQFGPRVAEVGATLK